MCTLTEQQETYIEFAYELYADKNNLLSQNMSKVAELLKTYTYNPSKPVSSYNGLSVYDAESKENSLKFTIKIMRRSDADIASYLQKLKSAAS